MDILSQIPLYLSLDNRTVETAVLVQKGAPNDFLLGTDVQPQLGFTFSVVTSAGRIYLLNRESLPTTSQPRVDEGEEIPLPQSESKKHQPTKESVTMTTEPTQKIYTHAEEEGPPVSSQSKSQERMPHSERMGNGSGTSPQPSTAEVRVPPRDQVETAAQTTLSNRKNVKQTTSEPKLIQTSPQKESTRPTPLQVTEAESWASQLRKPKKVLPLPSVDETIPLTPLQPNADDTMAPGPRPFHRCQLSQGRHRR